MARDRLCLRLKISRSLDQQHAGMASTLRRPVLSAVPNIGSCRPLVRCASSSPGSGVTIPRQKPAQSLRVAGKNKPLRFPSDLGILQGSLAPGSNSPLAGFSVYVTPS